MNKVAAYLQSHISGEVLTSESARSFFATDASVLKLKPNLVVYPRTTNDVRKVARFAWQLAEKGHALPITARGSGTDQTGAAIGRGMVMVFPAHMNHILEIDTKSRMVRLQPGVNFKSLQETLQTHGLFLPPYPASYAYSTIGGALANNSAGEKSLKYGAMREWVDRMEVVLANGEVIQTGRLSRRELDRKKGQADFEGEVYRAVDGIVSDNADTIEAYYNSINVTKNSVGYSLGDVKRRDGSLDLTPLFVGSQGTLGIVSEVIMKTAPHSAQTQLVSASFSSLESALAAVELLRPLQPSALEMVDRHLLEFVEKHQGASPHKTIFGQDGETPAVVLLIEFDDAKEGQRNKKMKKTLKLLKEAADQTVYTSDPDEQQILWSVRHAAAAVVNFDDGGKASVPFIEDGIVPPESLRQFIEDVYELFKRHHLEVALWGHAGDANIHLQPLLDMRKVTDRQKLFKLMDEYYRLVLKYGGSIAAEHNDGRLRTPYVAAQVGQEMADIFTQIKTAFDPQGILNPGVKTGTQLKDLVGIMRDEYNIAHLSEHLPRT
jgi:FAD/FMN-containing dehydrogenase